MSVSKITIPIWLFSKVKNPTAFAILSFAIYFYNLKEKFFLDIDHFCLVTNRKRSQFYEAISYLIDNEFLKKIDTRYYTLGIQTLKLMENVSGKPESKSEKANKNSDKADKKSDMSESKEFLKESLNEKENEKKKEKGEKEEAPSFSNFSSEFKEMLSDLVSGPWKKKEKISLRENLRFLAKYDENTAIEMLLYTIRGNYPQFFTPNEEVKNAAAARANARACCATKEKYSGISDKLFLSQQPSDKVPTDFRTRVRREWGNLHYLLMDAQKEVFFNNPVAFEFEEKTGKLTIRVPKALREILEEKAIVTSIMSISEVSEIQIIT